jgi:1,4-dihydroxy-2-naphthoate polyprenyltransferase
LSVYEPTLERLSNPLLRYFLATRPPFLGASLVPCLIGIAAAHYSGVPLDALLVVLTLLGAVVIHAGINVLNDYYDALSGTDDINTERLFPFTGGSRFIQNAVLSLDQTRRFGWALLGAGMALGLWLTYVSGPGLLVIGGLGLLIGWAYSAPPLALNSRGLGEICVAVGFGVLLPVGADFVQRGAFDWFPLWVGLPYGLLVTNILYINQFPDRHADAQSGKHHWVVRLGARRARWIYALIVGLAYALLALECLLGWVPPVAIAAILPLAFSLSAARQLLRYAEQTQYLVPAIQLTLLAALTHGLILVLALGWAGFP